MNEIKAMMWKDMRYIVRKKLLFYMVGVVAYIVIFSSMTLLKGKNADFGAIFDLLFLSLIVIIFIIGTTFISSVIFRNERNDFMLPSLLAGPLNIKDIFYAKFIITFTISYIFTMASFMFFIVFILYEKANLPSIQTILTAVITIPIWGFVLIEVIGLLYLLIAKIQYVQIIATFLIVVPLVEFTNHPLKTLHFPFLWTLIGVATVVFLYFIISKMDKERVMRVLF